MFILACFGLIPGQRYSYFFLFFLSFLFFASILATKHFLCISFHIFLFGPREVSNNVRLQWEKLRTTINLSAPYLIILLLRIPNNIVELRVHWNKSLTAIVPSAKFHEKRNEIQTHSSNHDTKKEKYTKQLIIHISAAHRRTTGRKNPKLSEWRTTHSNRSTISAPTHITKHDGPLTVFVSPPSSLPPFLLITCTCWRSTEAPI